MPSASLADFFEHLFAVESGAADLLSRLAGRLERHPELAAQVRGLEDDERSHLELLKRFRDSLPPAVLAGSCDEAAVRQLGRVAGLLEGDPAVRFADFEEAYEFIQEFQNNELTPLLRLLERECRTESIDCSAVMLVVEQRLARLDGVADAAGARELRRAIRL